MTLPLSIEKALREKSRTAFEIQEKLERDKVIAYPHDYRWVSVEDVKSLLAQVFSQEKVLMDRKQLSTLLKNCESHPYAQFESFQDLKRFFDGVFSENKEAKK